MFGMSKLYLYGAIGILTVSFVGGGVFYVKSLQKRAIMAEQRAIESDYAYEVTAASLRSYASEISERNNQISKIMNTFKEASNESEKAMEIFRSHKLQKLLEAKPGLVLRRINRATISMWDDLEKISRGDLTRGGDTDVTTAGGTEP